MAVAIAGLLGSQAALAFSARAGRLHQGYERAANDRTRIELSCIVSVSSKAFEAPTAARKAAARCSTIWHFEFRLPQGLQLVSLRPNLYCTAPCLSSY